MATVSTVADALAAANGTYADLTGSVTSWTEESDGEGVFADGTGSINIDFDGSKPSLSQNVVVLGRVTTDDGLKEVDVVSWYEKDGGTAPEIPVDVAFTISEAKTMPIGSYAYLDGVLSSWITPNDE